MFTFCSQRIFDEIIVPNKTGHFKISEAHKAKWKFLSKRFILCLGKRSWSTLYTTSLAMFFLAHAPLTFTILTKRVVRQLIRVLRRNDRTNQKTKTANNLSDNSRTSDNWKTQFENTSHMIYRQRRLCSKFSLISMILRSCHEIL